MQLRVEEGVLGTPAEGRHGVGLRGGNSAIEGSSNRRARHWIAFSL